MIEPPKDRRILLHFYPRLYYTRRNILGRQQGGYENTPEPKWEECRWVDNKEQTGSDAHWEPWTGDSKTHTSEHIRPEQVIGWRELEPQPHSGDSIEGDGYYWFKADRATGRSIAQRISAQWFCVNEVGPVTLEELMRRGWHIDERVSA